MGAGALLLWEKKIPPPPSWIRRERSRKIYPPPAWHGEKQPPPGVRDTHTPAGMSTLAATGHYQQTHPQRRKRQIMARSSRWPYIRRMAWNRDRKRKAPCHICGEPIDYFVPPSSTPDSYEPDHLLPVHLRPDLELDLNNIAPSHRRCNRARGDGTNGTNTIGMRSRKW